VTDPGPWVLVDLEDRLSEWIGRESPTRDRREWVRAWVEVLERNPYELLEPVPASPDWWFGRIPTTLDASETVVTCLVQIVPSRHEVLMGRFASLGVPIILGDSLIDPDDEGDENYRG